MDCMLSGSSARLNRHGSCEATIAINRRGADCRCSGVVQPDLDLITAHRRCRNSQRIAPRRASQDIALVHPELVVLARHEVVGLEGTLSGARMLEWTTYRPPLYLCRGRLGRDRMIPANDDPSSFGSLEVVAADDELPSRLDLRLIDPDRWPEEAGRAVRLRDDVAQGGFEHRRLRQAENETSVCARRDVELGEADELSCRQTLEQGVELPDACDAADPADPDDRSRLPETLSLRPEFPPAAAAMPASCAPNCKAPPQSNPTLSTTPNPHWFVAELIASP
jgi:hypothetical protein